MSCVSCLVVMYCNSLSVASKDRKDVKSVCGLSVASLVDADASQGKREVRGPSHNISDHLLQVSLLTPDQELCG
jgi:hypothetical protein